MRQEIRVNSNVLVFYILRVQRPFFCDKLTLPRNEIDSHVSQTVGINGQIEYHTHGNANCFRSLTIPIAKRTLEKPFCDDQIPTD